MINGTGFFGDKVTLTVDLKKKTNIVCGTFKTHNGIQNQYQKNVTFIRISIKCFYVIETMEG